MILNKNIIKKTISNSEFLTRHSSPVIRHSYLFIFVFLLTSCVTYSLSGGGTGTAKTLTIRNFFLEAAAPPNLPNIFNEKLRDYYQQNSKLNLVQENGDWILDGRIISYTVTPVAPSGTGTAAINRLTIAVSVVFVNAIEGEVEGFESVFSFYEDFPQTQTLSQVESELIDVILNRIVFDIFTRTTSNW